MISRKWLIIAAIVLVSGCSSSPQPKSYYQLPSLTTTLNQKSAVPAERQIQLVNVNVADYLNGLGVVYQTSDVQYVMAANNLWAGSLQQQLQQALLDNLNAELPGWLITNQSVVNGNKTLTVNVSSFHGRYDGQVIVRGEWILAEDSNILTKSFDIQLPQADDGYDSLVRTLAQAWQMQSEDMARTIALSPSFGR